jgi:2-oxoisovalerate dehydrogenase E1 component beta subunit
MEPKLRYRKPRAEVPAGEYTIPLGEAKVVRPGRQVTVLAWGAMVHTSLEAAAKAEAEGLDLEVVDLRTLVPFDEQAILSSVKKTGRVVIVHEAPRTSGFGAELSATIAEKAILHLEAPIVRVTGFDTPFPYTLEQEYLPDVNRILDAVRHVVSF